MGVTALFSLILTVSWPPAALAQKQAPMAKQELVWGISGGQVVNYGKTAVLPQGTLTTGYTVEALATAKGRSPIPEGKFQATLSAFTPKNKMGVQIPGVWYVKGTWTITNTAASKEVTKIRHNPATLSGDFLAELPFNPATDTGPLAAKLRVPQSPIWGRGNGTFSGESFLEGQIYLILEKIKQSRQGRGKQP
jgi:hypothetical protein